MTRQPNDKGFIQMNALIRPAGIVAMAIIALLLGIGVATITGPRRVAPLSGNTQDSSVDIQRSETTPRASEDIEEPPVFFYASTTLGADLDVVAAEIKMASSAGIHRHVLTIELPWGDDWNAIDRILEMANRADRHGRFYLDIDLNPSSSWLARNVLEKSTADHRGVTRPSIASKRWRKDLKDQLALLVEHLKAEEKWNAIDGCILSGLEGSPWAVAGDHDRSAPNVEAFREWLRTRYSTDEEFRKTWNTPGLGIDDAEIPTARSASKSHEVFLDMSKDRSLIDYRLYSDDQTVAAINEVVSALKAAINRPFEVLVRYGNGLSKLMQGEADGFIVNISPTDRGIGGAGVYAALVDSIRLHGKQCYLFDDTRTGIGLREGSNEILRPLGLRSEDILNVYRRNFAAAVVKGMGVMWADPNGTGNLHDEKLWRGLGSLKKIYAEIQQAPFPELRSLGIAVVVDEGSRVYEIENASIADTLYSEITNIALQTGAKTSFILFDDLIDGRTPPALAYLFLNTFEVSVDEMKILHRLLDESDAVAIWMYASGYVRDTSSNEHISELTRIHVSPFKEKFPTTVAYAFSGNWIAEGQSISMREELRPQFFIDDEEIDPIAYYAGTEWPSIAIKFLDEGWTSVYVGMPKLSSGLLKEILDIADVPLVTRRTSPSLTDTFNMNDTLMYIHASGSGVRIFDFEETYDILDLFDKTVGWPQKRSLSINMETGDTHLFQLLPSYESTAQ